MTPILAPAILAPKPKESPIIRVNRVLKRTVFNLREKKFFTEAIDNPEFMAAIDRVLKRKIGGGA